MDKKKENMFMFYFLSFTWGIIFTLAGLLTLLVIRLFFNRFVKEYRVVAGRIAIVLNKRTSGALDLGLVFILDYTSQKSYRLNTHEIGHSIQNAWFGPFFIFIVAIPSVIRFQYRARIKRKDPSKYYTLPAYDDIWFEGQATRLGDKYCGERVTEYIKTL